MNDRSLDLSDALDRNVEGMNRRAPTRVFRGGPALATAEVQDGLAFEGPDLGEVRAPHLVETTGRVEVVGVGVGSTLGLVVVEVALDVVSRLERPIGHR